MPDAKMIEFTVSMDGLEEFLETKAEKIIAALREQMQAETLNLLSFIKDDKLSGQVLNQRSGNLKNSGFMEVTETPELLEGTVSFGRTVPYAAIQNYGGTIPEVTDKLMVFQRDGATIFTRRHRAFDLPARNYMESSLEEKKPEIIAALQEALDGAVKE